MSATIRDENPTTNHVIGLNAEIFCFGKPTNYHWCPNRRVNFSRIIALARLLNVRKVFVPSLRNMTGRMANPQDFLQGFTTCGISPHTSVSHGTSADGMNIPQGTGMFLASADCPTTVIATPKRVTALHCARDSLLDHKRINTGEASREHVSIINAALSELSQGDLEDAEVLICCGTGPFNHPAWHPQYGEYNRKLADFLDEQGWGEAMDTSGNLDLATLITVQLRDQGVSRDQIRKDGVDTYKHRGWWSHRRGDKERNGIFVIHR